MRFLWYDQKYLDTYWMSRFGHPNFEDQYLQHTEWYEMYRLNRLFSDNPFGLIQDRTNHITHPFSILTGRIYQWNHEPRSFSQVSLDTARNIAQSTDRQLAVTWSGGIDSTVALVALLQTVDWKRLTVVCSKDSVLEYPGLWNDIIRPNLDVIDPIAWCQHLHQYYTISGDGGDTTWAVLDDSFYQKSSIFNQPWKDWAYSNGVRDLGFIEKFCSFSGRPIMTVLDLRTWFYLCCKWQDKIYKFYADRPGMTRQDGCPFYDFDGGMETWAMNNLDKIIGPTWTSYKMPAKQFIYDFHKDSDYLNNKTKWNSTGITLTWKWMIQNNQCQFAIDENYTSHYLECWPFMDQEIFHRWNYQYTLIHPLILEEWPNLQ